MIQKIENKLTIHVRERLPTGKTQDIDFTGATNILLVIKQKFGQYVELPAVVLDDTVIAILPYSEAMKFSDSPAEMQLLWTDVYGNKRATKIKPVPVDKLLREAGYD